MPIFDNGLAPITNVASEAPASVPRSKFNMSCVKYTNGIIGALMPIDLLETLPNEDYQIGYDVLAQLRNPTVRQALNGMKIFVHSYWCPKKDLWRGFKNYITGGRSGSVTLEVPKLCPIVAKEKTGTNAIVKTAVTPSASDVNTFVPFAPSSYMGLPIVRKPSSVEINVNKNKWYEAVAGGDSIRINPMMGAKKDSETEITNMYWGVSALPFVMYNKVYRDFYANQNLLAKNKNWFHDDEDEDLILPYSLPADNLTGYTNCTDGTLRTLKPSDKQRTHVPTYNLTETDGDHPILNMMHFRQFRGDYFTTANIFKNLIRGGDGDEFKLNLDTTDFFKKIGMTDIKNNSEDRLNESMGFLGVKPNLFTGDPEAVMGFGFTDGTYVGTEGTLDSTQMLAYKNAFKNAFDKIKISGSLNALRKAIVMEKLLMRNATTNGSYRELIGIQFGYYPNDYTRKPIFIGGTSYDVNFNTVTATNYDSQTNNLGQKTSEGYASGSGYIGKFHSDDHGYIMTIMSIVPDVYYANQGLDTMFCRTTKDQEYTPILNNLEPMAIKNKELFLTSDSSYNEDVWGYADRFEDWKSRRNKISGLAVCGELYDRAQFMFREFEETNKPNLNDTFLAMTPDNIDMSMFSDSNEPPFDLTIGCNITKVSPMPYKAKPADLGIAY